MQKNPGLSMENTDSPVNILIVDDRPENLMVLEAVLDSPSYHLIRANSGGEALAALLKYDFAVILLDIQMPELSGYDTAILIKQRERNREIPIIFITAIYKDDQSLHRAYQSGGTDFLIRPFEPGILRAKVTTYVGL